MRFYMPPLKHYYHIYADGLWHVPVAEHTKALVESGLYDHITFNVGIVGTPENREAVKNFIAIPFQVSAEADKGFEQVTMDSIDLSEDSRILYCHTKGAANPSGTSDEWRRTMTTATIHNWETAVAMLDRVDAAGCYWRADGFMGAPRHFSGTFWWANAEYLRRLPHPIPRNSRWDAEMWIGSVTGPAKVYDLCAGLPVFPNRVSPEDLAPPPEGYEKFISYSKIQHYRAGIIYVEKVTPAVKAALDQGIHMKRVSFNPPNEEGIYSI